MGWYFIACTYLDPERGIYDYDDYIRMVKPIVEQYGGVYLVRSERIKYLGEGWKPDRMIVIRFPDRGSLDACFSSEEYGRIMGKRISSVDSHAIIVPAFGEGQEVGE